MAVVRQFLNDNAPLVCALVIAAIILAACDGDGLTEVDKGQTYAPEPTGVVSWEEVTEDWLQYESVCAQPIELGRVRGCNVKIHEGVYQIWYVDKAAMMHELEHVAYGSEHR